jgi:hypothetical protein
MRRHARQDRSGVAEVNETTDDHKAAFARHMVKWQRLLNLDDYRIQPGSKPARGAMADMSIDIAARLAVWRLGKSFGMEPVTAHTLEATAVHELLHVLLAEFGALVETKAADDLIASAEHRIINTLERLLVPPSNEA